MRAPHLRGITTDAGSSSLCRQRHNDEDHSQIRTGGGPQVMATLRNTAISVLRLNGHTNIAAALRHHSRNHLRPIKLLLNS
jgi:hypothetical protein